jgi:hypothetical protein
MNRCYQQGEWHTGCLEGQAFDRLKTAHIGGASDGEATDQSQNPGAIIGGSKHGGRAAKAWQSVCCPTQVELCELVTYES